MSSLRITLAVLAVSLGSAGCAAVSGSDEVTASGENRAQLEDRALSDGDEQTGESQSLQRRYGGGGGGGGYCYGLEDGTYCGGNQVSGDPNTLYECVNGRQYFRQYCDPIYSGGYGRRYGGGGGGGGWSCVRMPPGNPDYCQ